MNGLIELRRLSNERIRANYPSLPEVAICPPKYSDKTHNGLTKCIVDFITLSGGWATRISTTGQMRPGGGTETNPKMKWIPGTTKRGIPDIMAVYQGCHLSIEVRICKYRQSTNQQPVRDQVNNAGEIYYLARNFSGFFEWFTEITKEGAAAKQTPNTLNMRTNAKQIYKISRLV